MAAPLTIDLAPAAAAEGLARGDAEMGRTWRALVSGEVDAVLVGRAAAEAPHPRAPRCLLPGSFNPVHEGHRGMLARAASRLRTAGAYELAVLNPDKPPLSRADAAARLSRFAGHETVWLTRAPTFPEKAQVFPGTTFAVGVDTIVRIAEPRYYGGTEGLRSALSVLAGCRFLVFGRHHGGRFETLESVDLPDSLSRICEGVPEAEFRADVSSTELRRERGDDGREPR